MITITDYFPDHWETNLRFLGLIRPIEAENFRRAEDNERAWKLRLISKKTSQITCWTSWISASWNMKWRKISNNIIMRRWFSDCVYINKWQEFKTHRRSVLSAVRRLIFRLSLTTAMTCEKFVQNISLRNRTGNLQQRELRLWTALKGAVYFSNVNTFFN